ncbi:hypothetical protein HC931_12275 [Candidatus Gracilibacteria bacterium]|nr:hypothetical protein [Candidatus Gracilibacteria bacterium]NJM89415.1 hypothetical protein [Hydrococcus sp. RU_2_2]NJP20183.1 hypothetical protein [Hydrococcus sp. CRU_1_1]
MATVQLRVIEKLPNKQTSWSIGATAVQIGDRRYVPPGAIITNQAAASSLPYNGQFQQHKQHQPSLRQPSLRLVA